MFSHSLPTLDAEVNPHLLDRDQQAPLASQEVTSWRDADVTCLGLTHATASVGYPPNSADSCGSRPATFDHVSVAHRVTGSLLTPS